MTFILKVEPNLGIPYAFTPKPHPGGFDLVDIVKSKFPLCNTKNIFIGANAMVSPQIEIEEGLAKLSGCFKASSVKIFVVTYDEISSFTRRFSKIVAERQGDSDEILVTVGFDSEAFILEWAKAGFPADYAAMKAADELGDEPKKALKRGANGRFERR